MAAVITAAAIAAALTMVGTETVTDKDTLEAVEMVTEGDSEEVIEATIEMGGVEMVDSGKCQFCLFYLG